MNRNFTSQNTGTLLLAVVCWKELERRNFPNADGQNWGNLPKFWWIKLEKAGEKFPNAGLSNWK